MTNEGRRPALAHDTAVVSRRGAELGDDREAALESLRMEARYRRERLGLYKARVYAGRARGTSKLRDLQRSSDGAAKRLRGALGHGLARAPAQPREPATVQRYA
jgi:hypothetical protein